MDCSIQIVPDQTESDRRAVAILEFPAVKHVNAKENFDRISTHENQRRHLSTSFDYWISGLNVPKRFHGWDKSEFGGRYTECFVFKLPAERFYGFLCHPRLPEDKRFQACVLVTYAGKHARETDETNLKRTEEMRKHQSVLQAIELTFKKSLMKELMEIIAEKTRKH